ncbi:hypothetical protein IU501_07025 [Nocardia otitidiscaviarum]|uniref:hypothetical protein n=1 Tax=Nocardia otitidiscaviarum TaxID=1823 RepID=UPI0004A6D1A3|nr:hypothetical protein [Nocardia otitidiscaviarum]MBF6132753.1 hypothetical protein [Nocardia otitidiscaviarum]MBF6486172.1 hypothetical protein [Nocardia otitidiscaviarum]
MTTAPESHPADAERHHLADVDRRLRRITTVADLGFWSDVILFIPRLILAGFRAAIGAVAHLW